MSRRSEFLPKTHAKSVYCLTDKDLETLVAVEKRNPRSRHAATMKLFSRAQLEALAHRKWGGPTGLSAEQQKREARRMSRAATKATSDPSPFATTTTTAAAATTHNAPSSTSPTAAAAGFFFPASSSSLSWLQIPPLLVERIRPILPLTLPAGVLLSQGPGQAVGAHGAHSNMQEDTAQRGAQLEGMEEVEEEGEGREEGCGHVARGRAAPAAGGSGRGAAEVSRRGGWRGGAAGVGVESEVMEVVDLVDSNSSGSEDERDMVLEEAQMEMEVEEEEVMEQDDGNVWANGSHSEYGPRCRLVGGLGPHSAVSGPQRQQPSLPEVAAAVDTEDASPAAAAEATSVAGGASARTGEYVLYWMKTAVRGHENPALDVARAAAARLGLPLHVACFVLPACQQHANTRRVKFLLEGLRDAQRELRDQGLNLLVHADGLCFREPHHDSCRSSFDTIDGSRGDRGADGSGRGNGCDGKGCMAAGGGNGGTAAVGGGGDGTGEGGEGWSALLAAAERAALVVTEDMPVNPDASCLEALVRHLKSTRSAAVVASPTTLPITTNGSGLGSGLPPIREVETAAAALGGRDAEDPVVGARRAAPVGVWAVDSSCVVPMQLVGRAYDKAYAYRSATEGLRRQRLRSLYSSITFCSTAVPLAGRNRGGGDSANGSGADTVQAAASWSLSRVRCPLGDWKPLDLQHHETRAVSDDCMGELAAAIRGVDNSVPGVRHMLGGSMAGYARWDAWRRGGGVARYAATRNDAMQRSGTSRLSPYLHWGMVSPFRIAREAAASGGSGAGKFLDEMLVWRELSYSFCFHKCPLLDSVRVLPKWAQDTLAAHASDPRDIKTRQQLETGTTGDAFWDAAQRQLDTTGELHNNVRMTWGKALLGWSASPQEALTLTLHLNHRYALDGCDPASYGGVLWCFGLFDGPKESAGTPVSGCLRRRPTSAHARRLDVARYAILPP